MYRQRLIHIDFNQFKNAPENLKPFKMKEIVLFNLISLAMPWIPIALIY
jgi:hypothetical protein